ncbi:ABC transporter ATP-binding protein [Rosistilla oblonga]|uniref:ABC transporter ATP-binding protein n=1 Tax=Rosistilla oblonga TaxID=2527990 RepID=UPI003A97F648
MSRPIISVENLSKAYRLGLKEEVPDTMAGALKGILRSPLKNLQRLRRLSTTNVKDQDDQEDTLWALKDVSFDIHQGDVVGIIGRNGAGKSTLLKILSRITEPTSGRAVIRGRVSSLLEVGTGFHPELSGRDNIYMNGTILGMTKREIDRKFDEIVDFSGVEKFLDTPTKRYSSGMQVRLAFAVAAHLEPEILIIDEVLAVGDVAFQQRCIGKMQEVANGGRTVLFVSHNMQAVESLCTSAIELDNGAVAMRSGVPETLASYRAKVFVHSKTTAFKRNEDLRYFKDIRLLSPTRESVDVVLLGGELYLEIAIATDQLLRNPKFGIGIDDLWGNRILTLHTPAREILETPSKEFCVSCRVRQLPLAPGKYTVKVALSENAQQLESIDKALGFAVVECDAFQDGRGFHRGVCVAPSSWGISASPSQITA